jgi:hypothetical protein
VLDLYEGRWEGVTLGDEEYVISADEKTSIQARRRPNPTLPADEGRKTRVEHGIEPFGRLVDEVMRGSPTPRRIGSSGWWTMVPRTEEMPR